jgi:hypothetical protein
MYAEDRTGCIRIGRLQVEEIVSAQQFSAATPQPRFVVRMTLKVQEDRAALAAKFGHLGRMQDPGFPVHGVLQLDGAEMRVGSLSYYHPEFLPDLEQLRLPLLEPTVKPAPPKNVPAERKEMKIPRLAQPLRPGEHIMQCGRDIIICDQKDTVVCDGRRVPCR